MSHNAVSWALKQDGMTGPQKSVLIVIAFHFNDTERRAWPSHKTIAQEASLNRATVVRAVTALEKTLGLVGVSNAVDDHGRQTSNSYYLPDYAPVPKPRDAQLHDAA